MKFKGTALIILTIFSAIYLSVFCGYEYMSGKFPEIIDELKPKNEISLPEEKKEEVKTESARESSSLISSSAVNVASSEPAIGKITAKFLNPYTSNTSYGKIHLKNNTSEKLDIEALYKQKLKFKIAKNGEPQVLLLHTHTTESFMLNDNDFYTAKDATRSRDSAKNMVAIGDIFEEKLKNAGIGVVHDATIHDDPAYTGSYDRAKETILKNLKKYPSIKIVLDIHRDSISGSGEKEKIKPIANINGKKYAQVMLVMGSQTGDIKNFPNWKENLSLALKYQQNLEVMYPGLARSITFNSAKYNENITGGSLLIEIGSEANTLDEAKLSAAAAAEALTSLLNTLQ
ncbi:MAG: stage II sporulation protein P [Clostridiales bacterium]|nr:stage II sporulation protein P [Candidatus Equinaster intestinalis]